MARANWDQTAALMATIANVNKDPKRPAVQAERLNPFRPKRMATMDELREMLR